MIDTGPDFREQMVAGGVRRLDAAVDTHAHADHLFGLDEIRRFNHLQKTAMPIFGTRETLADIVVIATSHPPPVAPGGLQTLQIDGGYVRGLL